MADAKRDQNRVPTLLGVSSTDGTTPLKAEITAATGRLRVDSLILGDNTTLSQDDTTNALLVLPYDHHEIHDGNAYSAYTYATGKNDGTKLSLYVATPNTTKWAHAVMQWAASGAAFGRILEAPTVTANTGTNAQVIYNHNRNSSNTSGLLDNATTPAAGKYCVDPTISADGTKIWEEYIGVGRTGGAVDRSSEEFILKQNTKYVFQVESDAAGLTLSIEIHWYEHANAN